MARAPAVFICYRRKENLQHAALLEESLGRILGPGAVFRDQKAIGPGDRFPARIEKAIRDAAVVLVLIGNDWLDIRSSASTQRRLERAGDYVRREIELALEHQRTIIPLLIDGASMPDSRDLPRTIAALSETHAVDLSWQAGLREIAEKVRSEEQRLAEEIRVPVGDPSPANAAARAMESSIRNQSLGDVNLDESELSATLDRLTDFEREHGAFMMPDLLYAIDSIGVKVKRKRLRYVARSKTVLSLAQLVDCLHSRRTVLAGLRTLNRWWEDKSSTRQLVDVDDKASFGGGVPCIVSGWNEGRREFEVHTFHPRLGKAGVMTLTYKAAERLLSDMRLIEAAPMVMPFSQKARRDLEDRLPKHRTRTAPVPTPQRDEPAKRRPRRRPPTR